MVLCSSLWQYIIILQCISCVDEIFLSLAQLRVFGVPLPPKVAQLVAKSPAISSTPAHVVAPPTHDNQEDAAPAENEGQLVVLVLLLP